MDHSSGNVVAKLVANVDRLAEMKAAKDTRSTNFVNSRLQRSKVTGWEVRILGTNGERDSISANGIDKSTRNSSGRILVACKESGKRRELDGQFENLLRNTSSINSIHREAFLLRPSIHKRYE